VGVFVAEHRAPASMRAPGTFIVVARMPIGVWPVRAGCRGGEIGGAASRPHRLSSPGVLFVASGAMSACSESICASGFMRGETDTDVERAA
jgi:hypothetical protein